MDQALSKIEKKAYSNRKDRQMPTRAITAPLLVRATRVAFILLLASSAASAQIQYYGYAGVSDPYYLQAMNRYTNVAEVGFDSQLSPDSYQHSQLLSAVSARGLNLLVDIGGVIWDPNVSPQFSRLRSDWQARLDLYLQTNSPWLVQGRLIAMSVLDEPAVKSANLSDYAQAASYLKAQKPWIKIWLVEAGGYVGYYASAAQQSQLGLVDWIGIDEYEEYPTSSTFTAHLNALKSYLPGRRTLYAMDAFWGDQGHINAYGTNPDVLAQVASDYYTVASNDPSTILIGIVSWDSLGSPFYGSSQLSCVVRGAHEQIGRWILGAPYNPSASGSVSGWQADSCLHGTVFDPNAGTECDLPTVVSCAGGNCWNATVGSGYWDSTAQVYQHSFTSCPTVSPQAQAIYTYALSPYGGGWSLLYGQCVDNPACTYYPNNHQPIGYLDGIDGNGYAVGWTCDPDAPNVSTNVVFNVGGYVLGPYRTNLGSEQAVADLCGGGYVHRFGVYLPSWATGYLIYAYGQDTMSGSSNLPGWQCPATYPACQYP